MPTILYYSAWNKPERMLRPVLDAIATHAYKRQWGLVTVTPQPVLPGALHTTQGTVPSTPSGVFHAILAGLDRTYGNPYVWLCEDDTVYADAHFEELPRHSAMLDHVLWYDLNMAHLGTRGYFERHNRGAISLSMASGRAEVIRAACKRKLEEIAAGTFTCYEPAGSLGYPTGSYRASVASIDIRAHNHTWAATDGERYVETEPGWPNAGEMLRAFGVNKKAEG